MKKKVGFTFMVSLLMVLTACGGNEKSPETPSNASGAVKPATVKSMKVALTTAKDHPITKGAHKFAELLDKETNGSIKAEVFSDGVLGGDVQAINSLSAGTLQATNVSTGPVATLTPKISVFDLPFLFKDTETAYKVLDGEIGKEILKELEKNQIIGLGYWENGFRNLTNSVREVKRLADVKGLKIRTLENKMHLDAWKELGTNPIPMSYTELFTALEQKVVDGQENPYANIRYSKFNEVQKYMTNTAHIYSPSVMLVSKKFWDSLTDKEKQAVQKASDEAKVYQRQLNKTDGEESLKYLKDNGMVVTDLTPEARQEFVDKLKPIYDKYKAQIGEELLNKILKVTGQ